MSAEVTALWKKLFLSLFYGLVPPPRGQGVKQSMTRVSGICSNTPSLILEVFCINLIQIWMPNNPLCSLNHPGQVLPNLCSWHTIQLHNSIGCFLWHFYRNVSAAERRVQPASTSRGRKVFVEPSSPGSGPKWGPLIPRNLMFSTRSTSTPCMSSGACAVLPDLLKSTITSLVFLVFKTKPKHHRSRWWISSL